MTKAIELHKKNGYMINIGSIEPMLGAKVYYPPNLLTRTPESSVVYISEGDILEKYLNGKKVFTFESVAYSHKVIISYDIMFIDCIRHNIDRYELIDCGEDEFKGSIFDYLHNFMQHKSEDTKNLEQELHYSVKNMDYSNENVISGLKDVVRFINLKQKEAIQQ